MFKNWCVQKRLFVCALSALLLFGVIGVTSLNAQVQTTATILGTVTDASGAAVAGAMITVKNADTGVTNTTVSDNQGRYNVVQLLIGTYEVDVEATGFKKYAHGGIVLSVGGETVVDVPLEVGTVSQTVTVESDVSHVETTSATLSSVVESKQMVDLPLNGRNFVNLIALQPGVLPTAASGGSFYGNQSNNAIGGYRPNGTAFMLDDTNTTGWWGHAPGNGATGTTLGIDSIAEFQTLTNTYSAQFAGSGAAVNSSSKSGTNSFHGTVYEFLRNTAVEAQNVNYTPTLNPLPAPVLNRNQFGFSLGGPIKKNRAFFFVNYEGLRQAQSTVSDITTPDLAARGCPSQAVADTDFGFCALNANGTTPMINGNPVQMVGCNVGGFPNSAYSNGDGCTAQKAMASLFSLQPWDNPIPLSDTNGSAQIQVNNSTLTTENYVLARFDYTLSDKDTFFARYLRDIGHVNTEGNQLVTSVSFPAAAPLIPNLQDSRDHFATVEERHIFSPRLLNTAHFAFTRPADSATQYASPVVTKFGNFSNCGGCPANQPLWFFAPELGGETGSAAGVSGATSTEPYYLIPNGFRSGDDVVWTHGAHSFKFGAEIDRERDNSFAPFTSGGSFGFQSVTLPNVTSALAGELQGMASTWSSQIPASLALAQGQPYPDAVKNFRQMEYAFYVQDDWKATNHLTANLGVRYDPTNDPPIVGNLAENTYGAFSIPNGLGQPLSVSSPQCFQQQQTTGFYGINCGYFPVTKVYAHNVSLRNVDPRIGLAWDPFKDHKTALRAGIGVTHVVLTTRDLNYWLVPPDGSSSEVFGSCTAKGNTPVTAAFPAGVGNGSATCQAGTPFGYPFAFAVPPSSSCTPATINSSGCTSTSNTSDYTQCCTAVVYQWNATVQREVMRNTVVTIGYVGSRGKHLINENDFNAPVACGQDSVTGLPIYVNRNSSSSIAAVPGYTGSAFINCPRLNVAYGAMNLETNQATSWYDSLQAGFNRRFSNGFQTQVSYTYSKTEDNISGGYGLDGGGGFCNPHNFNYCKGPSSFNRTHNFRVSAVYLLPFHQNQLVDGWQVSGIGTVLSGAPFGPVSFSRGVNGVNYVAGCDVYSGASASAANNKYLAAQNNTGQYPIGTGSIVGGVTTPYLNPNCFTLAPVGEYGNLGRNVFTGPGSWDIDMSIYKDTKITKISENFVLQFRAEFYNVMNHPSFGNPSTTLWGTNSANGGILGQGCAAYPSPCAGVTAQGPNNSTVGFGGIGNPTSLPRQMQFGLRASF